MFGSRIALILSLASAAAIASAQTPQFVISTVAGAPPLAAAPVQSLSVAIGSPQGVATDATGNVYFTTSVQGVTGNNNALLKLDQSGSLIRVAGYSGGGYSGDGGPATAANLNGVSGVVVDKSGNVYITDWSDGNVRKVASDGTITRIAGMAGIAGLVPTGLAPTDGDGGPATNARLTQPRLLAMDAAGNLYVGESAARVRKISLDGTITTVAGNGSYGYSGDGGPATAAQIGLLGGLAVDLVGNLYISDNYFIDDGSGDDSVFVSARVRMISSDGMIHTIAGSTPGYSGDGGVATSAQLIGPGTLATDIAGNLYIVDGGFNYFNRSAARIRKISLDGTISTIAGNGDTGYSGDGGAATNAQLGIISGVATDRAGNVYLADATRIRKISSGGIIATVAGDGDSQAPTIGDGGSANAATLSGPTGVAVDSAGVVYIADTFNDRIRKVTSDGVITTVAGVGSASGYGDGMQASKGALFWPSGLAIDSRGNLYIADSGNGRIRVIYPDGIITSVAGLAGHFGYSGDGGPATSAQLSWPKDIALDAVGNLYIADTGNNRIRMVTSAGEITTIAGTGAPGYNGAGYGGDGGPAVGANLNFPSGVAVDPSGNVYIADTYNFRVRKIAPSGIITTLVGNGTQGRSGDGGAAVEAQLTGPVGLKRDSAGNLYIADGSSVRMVTPAGIITTVAGTGVPGFSGDGGPATNARLGAWGLTFDGAGNLYIADPWLNSVRVLRPVGR